MIKSADEFESNEDLNTTMPNSVLTTRIDKDLEKEQKENRPQNKKDKTKISYSKSIKSSNTNHQLPDTTFRNQQQQEEEVEKFPTTIKPMLATLVDEPFNSKDWVFEVKWDGVRSILFFNKLKRTIELQSRSGKLLLTDIQR